MNTFLLRALLVTFLAAVLPVLAKNTAATPAAEDDPLAWTEPGTRIVFPPTLGTLVKMGEQDYGDPALGVSVRYQIADYLKADVYIYNMGVSNIPSGIVAPVVSNHFNNIVREFRIFVQRGYYADLKLLDRTTRALVGGGWTNDMLCQCLTYREMTKGETGTVTRSRKSYLLVTGHKNQFLKVRFTFLIAREKEGDIALDAFLRDLGRQVGAAEETKPADGKAGARP